MPRHSKTATYRREYCVYDHYKYGEFTASRLAKIVRPHRGYAKFNGSWVYTSSSLHARINRRVGLAMRYLIYVYPVEIKCYVS